MLATGWWFRIVEDGIGESYVFGVQDFRFMLVNRQARLNLGYEAAELFGMTPWDIQPALPEHRFREMILPLVSGEQALAEFETVHCRKDSSHYDVKVRLQLLRSGDDAVFFAAIEDVTAAKRADEQLRRTTDRLDAIANNTRMALFMMDDHQRCTFMNAAGEAMTGFSFAEVQGRVLHDVIHHTHPDGRDFPLADCAIDRAFPENNQQSGEEVFVHRDGSFYPVGFTASPMRDDAGTPVGTIIEVRLIADEIRARETMEPYQETLKHEIEAAVSQLRQAEVQLIQAQKMEAIGNLTGGIAHDFNNTLQVIKGNLDLLSQNVVGNDAAERRVRHARAGVMRGARLTAQLLAFGRRQPLEPSALHLGRLLQGLDDMLRRTLSEAIEIEIVVNGGLWNCNIDRAQIENAILNLAINARDAMDNRGKLTLEVSNAALDDDHASRHADVVAGQYVMLAVTDTGCGMTPDILEKVFEPFFSTKPEGQGTGLGLSMVYGFVKQSGGHLKIYSEVGVGTTVRVYLPRTRLIEDALVEPAPLVPAGGSEAILVVEDDEAVRATAVDLLTSLGYRVLKAANADAALAIVESGVAIDLLFTDVVMPGTLKSTDLARLTVAAHPGAAMLFASGYTQNVIVHAGRLDEGVDLLSKPYGRDSLARKVRQVLERRPSSRGAPNLPVAATPPQRLRVLALEDEALIRMVLAEILAEMGHAVTEAATVAEATRALDGAEFDVLVTDVSLPDGSGLDFAREAVSRHPRLRVVVASGGSVATATLPDGKVVLEKPYDEATLRAAIAAAIRG